MNTSFRMGRRTFPAQYERELIGQRTKAQGHKLGMPNITPAVTQRGLKERQQNAKTHQAIRQAAELIRLYQLTGLTYQAIAQQLNQMGYRTRRGKEFFAISVQRLYPTRSI